MKALNLHRDESPVSVGVGEFRPEHFRDPDGPVSRGERVSLAVSEQLVKINLAFLQVLAKDARSLAAKIAG